MTSTLESIDAFINSLHAAYKSDRVYVIRDIKLKAPQDDIIIANAIVAGHVEGGSRTAAQKAADGTTADGAAVDAATKEEAKSADPAAALIAATYAEYELTDPHHPEYGKVLIGESRDDINCTLVVNYLFYRADNITPQ